MPAAMAIRTGMPPTCPTAPAGAGCRVDGRPVRPAGRIALARPVLGNGAGRHHPALGHRWCRTHPCVHDRPSRWLRVADRGRRRDLGLHAAPATQVRAVAACTAARGRQRPLALALGSAPGGRAGPRQRAAPGCAGRSRTPGEMPAAAGQRRPQ
ncbi:hypothetical protein G6F58_013083 [Rhizopus delemar]|nr:hypothetical protein G6F58_013083 [Rhizopus delemar]